MPLEWDVYRGLYYDTAALGSLASTVSAFLFSHGVDSGPMLISGPSSCGKTLLATGIAAAAREKAMRVRIAPASKCAAGVVTTLVGKRSCKDFRSIYLENDVVILEEYDRLQARPQMCQELHAGLIAPLLECGKRVVVTCIGTPNDESLPVGVHIRLEPVSFATRLAYTRACCGQLQLELDEQLQVQIARTNPLHAIRGLLLACQLQRRLAVEQRQSDVRTHGLFAHGTSSAFAEPLALL